MRSYTNRKGDKVTVSEDHLMTAIAIKLELQKASPSRKCSYAQLVKLMEVEGYEDAENSESYRQMIKNHQKSIGQLPEVQKYADMVSDGKLESIKELVGDLAYEKRENQHVLRNLNKVKRDVIDFTLTAEQIGNAFKNHDFSSFELRNQPVKVIEGTKALVTINDWHIGAEVDSERNTYNFEVAKDRMSQFLSRVVDECKEDDIQEVYVMLIGDMIEHPYMHNLSYTSEFDFADQVANASDLVMKFLIGLEKEGFQITYAGIAGNHDRLSENKNVSLDGDHAVKIINKAVQSFLENTGIETITYQQAKNYDHSIEINNRRIKLVHGDLDAINDKHLIGTHSSLDGVDYSILVMGHYHHFRHMELGYDKHIIVMGSLKGADSYGEKTRRVSCASQGMIKIAPTGEIEVIRIELK